ncbi:hypothetical protein XENTR_v10017536 [Xenopus tropicalis]|nr:hypothetical protein XENTR_v10017536 [Xenopus tropicalis]
MRKLPGYRRTHASHMDTVSSPLLAGLPGGRVCVLPVQPIGLWLALMSLVAEAQGGVVCSLHKAEHVNPFWPGGEVLPEVGNKCPSHRVTAPHRLWGQLAAPMGRPYFFFKPSYWGSCWFPL